MTHSRSSSSSSNNNDHNNNNNNCNSNSNTLSDDQNQAKRLRLLHVRNRLRLLQQTFPTRSLLDNGRNKEPRKHAANHTKCQKAQRHPKQDPHIKTTNRKESNKDQVRTLRLYTHPDAAITPNMFKSIPSHPSHARTSANPRT